MKHAFKRKTFGKKLIEHPVIRFKLAQMARQVESAHAWLESITYQLCTLSHSEQNRILGGQSRNKRSRDCCNLSAFVFSSLLACVC